MKTIFLLVAVCGCFLASSCGMAAADPPAEVLTTVATTEKQPNRRQLMRQERRSDNWKIVVCVDQSHPGLDTALTALVEARPFDRSLEILSCDSLGTEDLGSSNLIFVGNQLPNGAEMLPVGLTSTGLSFQNADFEFAEIADGKALGPWLKLSYYLNPWSSEEQPQLMHLWYGPNAASIGHCILAEFKGNWDNVFWTSWAYELATPEERRMGNYQDTTWAFAEQGSFVLKRSRAPFATDDYWSLRIQDDQFDPQIAERVKDHLTARASALEVARPQRPIPVYIYPTVESIGLHTGRMDTAFVETENPALHLVANEWTYGEKAAEASYLLLRDSLLQQSGSENLSWGIARYFSPERKQLMPYWWQLSDMGVLRSKDEVLSDQEPEEGRSLLFLAIEQLGLALEHFQHEELLSPFNGQANESPHLSSYRRGIPMTQKGMTFAHEGYRIYNGYGGSTVPPALDALAEVEVNSIALVPYSFMRGPQSLRPIPVVTSAGAENDHATMASAKEAHSRGWSVLLKPQIWISGHWPGDIDQDNEEDWEQFFYNYEQWILHYAILADRHNIATFCMGTEMRHTTLKQPERWRELIAKVRRLYRGRLTYAANWGEEMEQMTFWSDFDVIGLNAYYPLSSSETPSMDQLKSGVQGWLSRVDSIAQAADRELWLTEVGFRSVEQAWQNPHAEAGERSPDRDAQAAAFQALTSVLEEEQCVGGMYVWKWPCQLGYMRGENDRGFTPYGKPAAEKLRSYYTQ